MGTSYHRSKDQEPINDKEIQCFCRAVSERCDRLAVPFERIVTSAPIAKLLRGFNVYLENDDDKGHERLDNAELEGALLAEP